MSDQYLSLAEAQAIRERNPPTDQLDSNSLNDIDLSIYTQADPAAIDFLAGQGYTGFAFFGLTHLDIKTASAIANWDVAICFSRLTRIDLDVAKLFARRTTILSIDIDGECLHEIDAAVAAELSKVNAPLGISLDKLTVEVADALANQSHELSVSVLASPSMLAQRALLFQHAGYSATRRFPVNGVIASAALYRNQNKRIAICSYTDDAGRLWQKIEADEYLDKWLYKQHQK